VTGGQTLYSEAGSTFDWIEGNFPANLDFVDAGTWAGTAFYGGDFHLQDSSPCIDAGDNSAIADYQLDIESNPRIPPAKSATRQTPIRYTLAAQRSAPMCRT